MQTGVTITNLLSQHALCLIRFDHKPIWVAWLAAGLFDISLNMLDAWTQHHAVSQAPAEGAAVITEVPRWIDALLLCLDMGMQPQPAPQTQPEQTPGSSAADPSIAAPPAAAQAPPTDAATSSSTPAATAPSTQAPMAEGAAASAAGQEGAGPSSTVEGNKEEPPLTKSVEERQQAATQMLRDNIRTMFLPNGLVNQQQLERAASICMKLLQHLHAWGSVWNVPDSEPSESEAFSRPQPASSTQAVVQVLARVTKSHKVALKVGLACLLLGLACLLLHICTDRTDLYPAILPCQPDLLDRLRVSISCTCLADSPLCSSNQWTFFQWDSPGESTDTHYDSIVAPLPLNIQL